MNNIKDIKDIKAPMTFEKFKNIMERLIKFQEKRRKVGEFIENELCEASFCYVSFGTELEDVLVYMLADAFKCWFSTGGEGPHKFDWWNRERLNPHWDNDIVMWLYPISDKNKTVTVNQVSYDINSLEDFYRFLVAQYEHVSKDLTEH